MILGALLGGPIANGAYLVAWLWPVLMRSPFLQPAACSALCLHGFS